MWEWADAAVKVTRRRTLDPVNKSQDEPWLEGGCPHGLCPGSLAAPPGRGPHRGVGLKRNQQEATSFFFRRGGSHILLSHMVL